ncbi:MAG: hypothetical protein LKJ69_10670, partial [Lactobacillus sp.]|nr:hypothetical protein [Lactobacillus sp.]
IASFSSAVCLDLGIQKSLHNHQMNYCISSDNHKGIIACAGFLLAPKEYNATVESADTYFSRSKKANHCQAGAP